MVKRDFTVKKNSDDFAIDIENVYKLKLGELYVTDSGVQNPLSGFRQ